MTTKTKTSSKRNDKVTLIVTAKDFGTRTMTWYGPTARKTAEYYRKLWTDAGHVVVDG